MQGAGTSDEGGRAEVAGCRTAGRSNWPSTDSALGRKVCAETRPIGLMEEADSSICPFIDHTPAGVSEMQWCKNLKPLVSLRAWWDVRAALR